MQESSPEAREIRRPASALVHRPGRSRERRCGAGQAADSEVPDDEPEVPDEALEESGLALLPVLLPDEVEELEDAEVLLPDRLSVR